MSSESDSTKPPGPGLVATSVGLSVITVFLVLCLCTCCLWLGTRGPSIRLMCRVSDTACASFCRNAPRECERLNLP